MDSADVIVFGGDYPASTLSKRVRRGELVRLARGLYSTDLEKDPAEIVREHLFAIVGRLLPQAVITDRSARSGLPVNGVLYVAYPGRSRDIELPGIQIRARTGAGPQDGDICYPGDVRLASKPRGLAENCLPSRSRRGDSRRTFTEAELGDWVDYICQNDGPERLKTYRKKAEELSDDLGVDRKYLAVLQTLVGIAVGERPEIRTNLSSRQLRRTRRPVDQVRIRKFESLIEKLRRAALQNRPVDQNDPERYTYLPFFEAYFSNFIEGTEFDVDEAVRIVYDNEIPKSRPADAHDVIGTYRLLADSDALKNTGENADEFLALLKYRNAQILEGRPDKRPGLFKELANRAGGTFFVEPDLVEGTLRAGFQLRAELDTAWERAVYIAFMVAEVHPFDDGNGRTARAMMSSELDAGGQARIIVPTVFRDDYLDGLRMLSRQDDASVLIKAMRYLHNFTASIDFSDYAEAKRQLLEANAFEEPSGSRRLRIL